MITDKEKIQKYEEFLHTLQLYVVAMDSAAIGRLVAKACDWSYAHRVGNGQHSDEEQQAIVDECFNKLTDV
jgi:hypothetical protein